MFNYNVINLKRCRSPTNHTKQRYFELLTEGERTEEIFRLDNLREHYINVINNNLK